MKKQKSVKLKDLKVAPYNPRKISEKDLAELGKSMGEFGDISGIVFNRRTGQLIGGHQRIKHLNPEAEIVKKPHKDETGTVAVGYVKTKRSQWIYREVDWSEEKEKFANIAANKQGGEWDLPKLKDLIVDIDVGNFDIDLTGFGYDELADLVSYNKAAQESLPNDEIPEKPKKPKTRSGDLIILGNHRLLCGDATNANQTQHFLNGTIPFIMVTDPPYGVRYDPEWRVSHDKSEKHSLGKVHNDDRVDWSLAYRVFEGDVAYVWHAGIYAGDVASNLRGSDLIIRSQIIWRKQHFVFSRGAYHWQHEPCWYAVRKGKKSQWCGDRTQSTLWEIENRNPFGGKKEDVDTAHSAQKPMECMGRPMRNHGAKGDIVYDPFLGTGTTLIAAEHLERRCFGIEIDPGYCDVAIERWEKLTGKKAKTMKSG